MKEFFDVKQRRACKGFYAEYHEKAYESIVSGIKDNNRK